MKEKSIGIYNSPIGPLTLVVNDSALLGVCWTVENCHPGPDPGSRSVPFMLDSRFRGNDSSMLARVKQELDEYFAGKRQKFDLPLEFEGTEFQKKVWQALLEIPYGETRSYADIAEVVGSPKAVRAVGLTNSKNPIPIVAPCHRVIGKNGQLTGYGGGLKKKEYLLELEHAPLG